MSNEQTNSQLEELYSTDTNHSHLRKKKVKHILNRQITPKFTQRDYNR